MAILSTARKHSHVLNSAVIIGVLTAISLAILYIVVLTNLWWNLQESFGHAMFHKLEYYVMGAEYVQLFSLLIVTSMTAGALTAYFNRSVLKNDKATAFAGAFSGLIIACTFSICAMIAFLLISAGMPNSSGYIASNAPFILLVSLMVPAIIAVPSAAAGAVFLKRNLSGVDDGSHGRMPQGTTFLVAIITAIILTGLIAAVISLYYNIPATYPLLYSIPLLITLPLLAAGMNAPYKNGSAPVVIVILALSVAAIVFLPIAGTLLACQTGLIYASPYEGEEVNIPRISCDFSVTCGSNTTPVMDYMTLAFADKHSIRVGLNIYGTWKEDIYLEGIDNVERGVSHIGIIGRELSGAEIARGLNQTMIAHTVWNETVFIVTKGALPTNVTLFIDFMTGPDGQTILAENGFVPT